MHDLFKRLWGKPASESEHTTFPRRDLSIGSELGLARETRLIREDLQRDLRGASIRLSDISIRNPTFSLVQAAIARDDIVGAISELDLYLRLGHSPEALYTKAVCQAYLGDLDGGSATAALALASDPSAPLAEELHRFLTRLEFINLLLRAERAFNFGDVPGGVRLIEDERLTKSQRHDVISALIQKIVTDSRTKPEIADLIEEGLKALAAEDWPLAVKSFREIEARGHTGILGSWQLQSFLSVALLKSGDYGSARTALYKARNLARPFDEEFQRLEDAISKAELSELVLRTNEGASRADWLGALQQTDLILSRNDRNAHALYHRAVCFLQLARNADEKAASTYLLEATEALSKAGQYANEQHEEQLANEIEVLRAQIGRQPLAAPKLFPSTESFAPSILIRPEVAVSSNDVRTARGYRALVYAGATCGWIVTATATYTALTTSRGFIAKSCFYAVGTILALEARLLVKLFRKEE